MRIYLDTCILVAYFSTKEESSRRALIKKCLKVFEEIGEVELCVSHWTIAEMSNVLISRMRMRSSTVAKLENELLTTRRLGGNKITILDVSSKRGYDINEFFYELRQGIISYHPGIGDTMHSIIMKNNKIETILTIDEEDFKKIPGLVVLHPKQIQ